MYLMASFRMERIGAAAITFDGASVSISTGRFAHVDMSAVDSTCAAFADALQQACIDAGKTSAIVTYSTTTHAYTLSNGGGSFAIAFPAGATGELMKAILGFTAGASATSHTSSVRPHYVIVPTHDGRSRYSGLRCDEITTRRQADDGRGYALGPSEPVYSGQWEHWHEPLAAVYNYAATAAVPWTWEALWLHAGRWQEYVLVSVPSADPEGDGVWQLKTPDFTESTHERQFPDGDFAWKIRIAAVRLGDLDSSAWSVDLSADGAFTRSSDGWYLTSAPTTGSVAFIARATTDTIRLEDRGDGAGALALLEGTRTNSFTRARDLSHADWGKNFATCTGAYGVGVDGTSVGTRVVIATDGNVYQSKSGNPGCMSIWVRATTGSGQSIGLSLDPTPTSSITSSITTTYTRATLFKGSSYTTPCAVDAYDRTATGGGNPTAVDVTVDFAQIEHSARFPSSVINASTVAASRSADTLTLSTSEYDALLLTGRGGFDQVSPVFASADLTSGDEYWLLSIGGSSNGVRIRHTGTDVRVEVLQGGIVRASSDALTFSRHALLGSVRWDPSAGLVYVGGEPGSAGTAWSWASASVRVGGIYGAANEAFCRLGTLASW